jgi:NADPH:quinone reductase-like Zn-dependent oxidoreductase
MKEILQALVTSMTGGRKVAIGVSKDTRVDLVTIAGLLENGKIKPIIDGHYPLERIADAHRRVESRHKTGSVVVTVVPPEQFRLAAA